MKKYFIVGDVHSFYTELNKSLQKKGFDFNNPNHIFVSCGDLLDRGNYPIECLRFVNSIPQQRKILIRGNHEDLLDECLNRKEFYEHDQHNGTLRTIMQLAGRDPSDVFEYMYKDIFPEMHVSDYHEAFDITANNPDLKKYMSSLQDYAEVGDYIFVHGWIPSRKTAPNKDWRLGNWEEARWFNGMEKWRQGARIKNKTIVCGHWHTSWGHSVLEKEGSEYGADADFSPFIKKGIIAIDGCTAHSGVVNCVVLEI